MSLAIQAARAQGDPGLFGFLGKAVGTIARVGTSFLPGPVGAIARGVTSKLPSFMPQPQARALPSVQTLPSVFTNRTFGAPPPTVARAKSVVNGLELPFVQPPQGTFTPPTGQPGIDATPAIGCPKGYKANKAGYYRRIKTPGDPVGQVYYIEPGSRCVKIRKRNAANPRAADRALNRIQSAKRFATKMNRVTIRKKCD